MFGTIFFKVRTPAKACFSSKVDLAPNYTDGEAEKVAGEVLRKMMQQQKADSPVWEELAECHSFWHWNDVKTHENTSHRQIRG